MKQAVPAFFVSLIPNRLLGEIYIYECLMHSLVFILSLSRIVSFQGSWALHPHQGRRFYQIKEPAITDDPVNPDAHGIRTLETTDLSYLSAQRVCSRSRISGT